VLILAHDSLVPCCSFEKQQPNASSLTSVCMPCHRRALLLKEANQVLSNPPASIWQPVPYELVTRADHSVGRNSTSIPHPEAGHNLNPATPTYSSLPCAPPMQDVVSNLGPHVSLQSTKIRATLGSNTAPQQTDSIGAIDYKELEVEEKPIAHSSVKSVFRAVWKRQQPGH